MPHFALILGTLFALRLLVVPNLGSVPEVNVVTLEGKEIRLSLSEHKAVVLVFLSIDCPISNSYAPELRRLSEEFSKADVDFRLIYPVEDQTAEQIRQHVREFRLPGNAFRDPAHRAVAEAQVRVTPEAAVYLAGSGWIYRGRIDDRHVDFGKARPVAVEHDLRDVLRAIVKGEAVTSRTTKAVGCYIPGTK